MTALEPTLAPTAIIDSDHAAVRAFALDRAGSGDEREQAVRLYYAVRDELRYDPYRIDLSVAGLRASSVLASGHGWCVNKAVLLAASCRVLGIPARLGYADVRNHLSTERLRQIMGSDVFHYHGYTAIQLEGRWVKATPAFNLSLCQKFGLQPLEFDGRADSIYHPYDLAGHRHMEYLAFRGERDDLPLAELRAAFAELYPAMPVLSGRGPGDDPAADFEADAARETGKP